MIKLKTIAIILVALAAVLGIGWHIYGRAQDSKPLPTFHFDASKASGWTGRDNINVQAVARSTTYKGTEPIEMLPIADLTIYHGEPNSPAEDNCFVMYSYFDRVIGDLSTAYKDYADRKSKEGALEVFDPIPQTISTGEGDKNYYLRQYRYTIDNQDALQGYQVGFVPLESGYIRVEGVCKTYEDLALTLPILQSVQHIDN